MSQSQSAGKARRASWPLMVGAIGVVYGDIGTSPLYTMRECLAHAPGDRAGAVLGCASLIFWALVLVVSIKYIAFILRADNQGEGGIFALLALRPSVPGRVKTLSWTVLIILAGAALLYGDGMITPAISVLSAAEGLKGVSPVFGPWVVPIACLILLLLFLFQQHGTARIGGLFGPVMLVWFGALAVAGAWQIVRFPQVLQALDPMYGLRLLVHYPVAGILGAVVLAITGAEALYADMGHFGRSAIARGWYCVAFPALCLNYFGQAAYLLRHPEGVDNPFFAIVPPGGLQFLFVGLSIVATVIASQALITGTFSLTRQAVHLGYFPRLGVIHTSADVEGQIYIPSLNFGLGVGCILIVLGFESSDHLASAYGIAVTGTMAVTTLAFYRVVRFRWGWSRPRALSLCAFFLAVDLVFFAANLPKISDGGWLPLLIGAVVFILMATWKRGRAEIVSQILRQGVGIETVIKDVVENGIVRVPGTAVFMSALPRGTPIALLHHLKANRCLHQRVILLTIATEGVPRIPVGEHLRVEDLGEGVWRAVARYGYMETPRAPELVQGILGRDAPFNPLTTTYFFNRETIISGGKATMWNWQKELYRILSQNARPARDYFGIPPNQIIEMGLPVQL